ncbi:zeta toxin family protein [Stenotrophomonas sp. STK17_22]|uniref:zeta toxin family protein n=1 Tax=Stenotrophomonas sp. STK17_22 TaxID=3455201 RepID=UPI003F7E2B93
MTDSAVELSDAESSRVFKERILPVLLSSRSARGPLPEQPTALLLGGQPAAGKTPHLNDAAREFSGRGATWVLNFDNLRAYHPHHDELIARHGSREALHMMKGESGKWFKMLLTEAQRRKVNIVMETTMRQPDVVAKQVAEFRGNGYKVHARVLAVPEQESWVSNRFRYEQMNVLGTAARLTPRSIHDEGAKQLLTTVAALEKGRAVDVVEIRRRNVQDVPIYRNELIAGEWSKAPAAAQTITAERARPWSPERIHHHDIAWNTVEKLAAARLCRADPEARHRELDLMRSERLDATTRIAERNARAALPKEMQRTDVGREVQTQSQDRQK